MDAPKRGSCKLTCTASDWDLITVNNSQQRQRGEQACGQGKSSSPANFVFFLRPIETLSKPNTLLDTCTKGFIEWFRAARQLSAFWRVPPTTPLPQDSFGDSCMRTELRQLIRLQMCAPLALESVSITRTVLPDPMQGSRAGLGFPRGRALSNPNAVLACASLVALKSPSLPN